MLIGLELAFPLASRAQTGVQAHSELQVLGRPDCGLLTDNMALMWGDVKDSVDELTAVMATNQANCKAMEELHATSPATHSVLTNLQAGERGVSFGGTASVSEVLSTVAQLLFQIAPQRQTIRIRGVGNLDRATLHSDLLGSLKAEEGRAISR